MGEVDSLIERITELIPNPQGRMTFEEAATLIHDLDAATERCLSVLATGSYWGKAKHGRLWARAVERLGNAFSTRSGVTILGLEGPAIYPALLASYAVCLGAIAGDDYATVQRVLEETSIRGWDGERVPAARKLITYTVLEGDAAQKLLVPLPNGKYKTPFSDHLHQRFRDTFKHLEPDDEDFAILFDKYEYILGLVHADWRSRSGQTAYGPVGRFAWRSRGFERLTREVDEQGAAWPPLKAGLFKGDVAYLKSIREQFDPMARRQGEHY
jgi:hypothetical protein